MKYDLMFDAEFNEFGTLLGARACVLQDGNALRFKTWGADGGINTMMLALAFTLSVVAMYEQANHDSDFGPSQPGDERLFE